MAEVVIVASAFGMAAIRRDGHRAFIDAVADAGAAGFEVRSELFASESDATEHALAQLGGALAAAGLWSVYSTPDTLYTDDGALNRDSLLRALAEADALGARYVKFQLGGYRTDAFATEIAECARGARARLLVENGQLPQGGALAQFVALFATMRACGAPDLVGMTFDIGNWQWPGEVPLDAARALAPHVEYIHCKAVAGEGARRFAVAPEPLDPVCGPVLALLPRDVPRGIEFPLDATNLATDASRRVAWLQAA